MSLNVMLWATIHVPVLVGEGPRQWAVGKLAACHVPQHRLEVGSAQPPASLTTSGYGFGMSRKFAELPKRKSSPFRSTVLHK